MFTTDTKNPRQRKSKKAKLSEKYDLNDNFDRRSLLPNAIHPGSYAASHPLLVQEADLALEAEGKNIVTGPKRRYALMLAYCGTDFCGMQMNPGIQTIEAEVEWALYRSGVISKENFGTLQKIGFNRAARTDKGVHALGQLVSAKLRMAVQESVFIEQMNTLLPPSIKLLDCVRTTGNFNSKGNCDKRTYEYLAPTYLFKPKESKGTLDVTDVEVDSEVARKSLLNYRMDTSTLEMLNQTLQHFVGTHAFHNYTKGLLMTDPSANRFIMSFKASAPFIAPNHGGEWVKIQVVGQSFLLHHIRKMVGTCSEVLRGSLSHVSIPTTFGKYKMDLPKAPSEGLYLRKTHYELYNSRDAAHGSLDIDLPKPAALVQTFSDRIYAHIFTHDSDHRPFMNWLFAVDASQPTYEQFTWKDWQLDKEAKATRSEEKNAIIEAAAIKGPSDVNTLVTTTSTSTATSTATPENENKKPIVVDAMTHL